MSCANSLGRRPERGHRPYSGPSRRLNANDIHVIARRRWHPPVWRGDNWRGLCSAGLRLCYIVLLRHEGEHCVASFASARSMQYRIINRWPLRHRGERCGFGKCEVSSGFPEVVSRGALDSVVSMPERDIVQVTFEDLFLVVVLFHFARGLLLAEFATYALIVPVDDVGVHVADQLLSDCACAAPITHDVVLDRAGDSNQVNTVVLVEALVLD